MDREIKFKVWDEWTKQMQPVLSIGFKETYSSKRGNTVLLQYIGLKDIHGTELYEGDVVRWGHIKGGEENPVRIAVVEINPDIQFKCLNSKDIFHYGNFAYKDTEKYLEKIGDIYTSNVLDGNFINERCPKCGSKLLQNGIGDKWCSLVGCDYYKEGGK